MSARHERFAASAVPGIKAAEIAIRELDAGRRLPAARRLLRRFLGGDRTGARHTAQL
jgi:hypothetical protein